MLNNPLVIGVDYGTDSVRSIVADAITGKELVSSIYYYPRWEQKLFCDAAKNQFRQHPQDYLQGLEFTILDCLQQIDGESVANIQAISIDTTGSTPIAVDQTGTPLALLSGFKDNPNAMFILWKDHTSVNEASEINRHAQRFDINYLGFVGGIYSSEWFWSKLLHVLREDPQVRNACYSWVEHCDWIPFVLTGGKHADEIKRGVCSAGHKALYSDDFGGFPPNEFFVSLDTLLDGYRDRISTQVFAADVSAGKLCEEWANRLGLSTSVLIGIGAFDAHMGAVGGQIEPYYLSKVMGTSTCDMLVIPLEEAEYNLVKGICGQVPGSIIPGMLGMEAGQSAFGDTYAWFKQVLLWPTWNLLSQSKVIDAQTAKALSEEINNQLISSLSKQASELLVSEHSEFAVDWFNGRRTPDANQFLKGAILGLSLGSDAADIFRALVEATCFGAKRIVDRFIEQGVPVRGLIGLGGVAKKSPFIMQMMADVINMPIRIHRSDQTCALGAAMFAATVAGIYPKVEDAMKAMGQGFEKEYSPDESKIEIYAKRYKKYIEAGAFIENGPSNFIVTDA